MSVCDVCEKPAVHDCLAGCFCDACLTGINKAIASVNALPEHAACGNCVNAHPHEVLAHPYWEGRLIRTPDRRRCSLLWISAPIEGRCQHWEEVLKL